MRPPIIIFRIKYFCPYLYTTRHDSHDRRTMALVLQHFGRLPGRMDVGRAYALLMAGDEEAGVQA